MQACVYATTSLSVPSVNGYTGLFPPHYAPLVAGLNDGDQAVLQTLSEYGPLAIIVRREEDPDGRWQHYVAAHNGIRLIESGPERLVYWLDKGAPHRALDRSSRAAASRRHRQWAVFAECGD